MNPRSLEILRALERNFREDRLHHAYIFIGPQGAGKLAVALRFAAFLFAEPSGSAVDSMLARVQRSGHPDLIVIEPSDGSIRVEDIRSLSKSIAYAPMEGARRVVLIQGAEFLNPQAANAILKTLEEPPPHTIFLLLSPNVDLLLPTVRSRCQIVRFFPLTEEAMIRELNVENKLDALTATRWAEGSLERAKSFLENDALREARLASTRALLGLWQACPRVPSESLHILEGLGTCEQAIIALDAWYALVRDLALCLCGGEARGFYHEEARASLLALAKSIGEQVKNKNNLDALCTELADKCKALHRLRVGFDFHVNQKLALDAALCELQLFSIGKIR